MIYFLNKYYYIIIGNRNRGKFCVLKIRKLTTDSEQSRSLAMSAPSAGTHDKNRNARTQRQSDRNSAPKSGSKGELSLSEVVLSLLLSESSERALVLCQSLSESSGLSVSQVIGSSLLLGVLASLVSSLLVDHSKHLSDGLSNKL